MRSVAAILALMFLLGGCNTVMSRTPLFSEADTADARSLRPGLWIAVDRKCRFDTSGPPARWPDCAEALVVDRNGKLLFDEKEPMAQVLAAGEPLILQIGGEGEGGGSFYFFSVRPVRKQWDGRVVALNLWLVTCGPEPGEDAKNADGSKRYVTLAPGAGLTVEGNSCVARDQAAVRAAATASERRGETQTLFKWLRAKP
jgi:hypothetical protein